MKLIRKAICAIVLAIVFSCTFQCSSSKVAPTSTMFVKPVSLKVKPVYFQEWYAGIKVGGTGFNVFVPASNFDKNITLDNVYFRNLKGKLIKQEGEYVAILKSKSRQYTFSKPEKPEDYPFDLADNECAISYIENGKTKYFKIKQLNEFAGTYYENGPPSIYERNSSSVVASTDDDDDEK